MTPIYSHRQKQTILRRHFRSTQSLFIFFSWRAAILTTLISCEAETLSDISVYELGEEFPGGTTTNNFLFGSNAFTMPVSNITPEHESLFFSGNGFFNQSWVQAPASTKNRDGLGPLYNARSCSSCHFKDGRGRPPLKHESHFSSLLLRLSIDGEGPHGGPVPDPVYGNQLQPFTILGVPAEGTPSVTYVHHPGLYPDGTPYELIHPTYEISDLAHGPMDSTLRISPRVAPSVVGLGLLEAIDEKKLLAMQDENDNNDDGISGRINWVWDVTSEALTIGRFGWKSEQPSVLQQSAGAFIGDMGITSHIFPIQPCTNFQLECAEARDGGNPELSDSILERVVTYTRLLAVPGRQRYNDPATLRGKKIFGDIGCASCHVPSHRTSTDFDLVELREQTIWPYTDLLLHDLGENLSDNRPVFDAMGTEWRTPPLWGLRFYRVVNGHQRLLHDGRARGIEEAILWHGGEAKYSRDEFKNISLEDRNLLVQFVESL